MRRPKVLFIFGTRPEAVKLCPVIRHFRDECDGRFEVRICVTAQHRSLLDQVLEVFGLEPHYDLNVMRQGQTLTAATSRILSALEPVLQSDQPDLVLVQGDTATTLAGALAAFYARIPIGHIEAGLRTGDMAQPFPEEMNRVVVGRLSTFHFAATPWAAANLRSEGVDCNHITVTGNTGIDAVLYIRDRLERNEIRGCDWSDLDSTRKLIGGRASARVLSRLAALCWKSPSCRTCRLCIRFIPTRTSPNRYAAIWRGILIYG
jgi:UDP-N-acetylglucosamine 2-epimerase (non-hydrolysing)